MQTMPPDSTIALSCQEGQLQDFDVLYTRYVKGIYGFVFYRVMDRATAEDLTSQIFLKALEKISSYDSRKGAFSTWLYRIARNTVTDHYRTRHPHDDIESVWDLQSDDDPLLDADGRMAKEHVRALLQTLPREKRTLVIMRLWDGLSYKEIAAITGKSESSLKMQFSRIIVDLRDRFPGTTLTLLVLFPRFL